MIKVKKTFSSHDQSGKEKYIALVLDHKGKILGTTTVTRHSPNGDAVDSSVTVFAEIPSVVSEIDMNSFINELDDC